MTKSILAGKTALITGAAKRLGSEMATALAGRGANIVVHYHRSEADAQGLCEKLQGLGVKAFPLGADLGDAAQCEELIPRALKTAGALDILINSASIFLPTTLLNMDHASFRQHLDVNAWSPFVLSRNFARAVGRGKILNLLDTRIEGLDFAHVAYLLSKQVLATLTRMTALEFAPNITVNAVAPGLILPPPGSDHAYLDRLAETVPLKRHGEASDIADAALYLLESDFITGEILHIDGGRHLRGTTHGSDRH